MPTVEQRLKALENLAAKYHGTELAEHHAALASAEPIAKPTADTERPAGGDGGKDGG